MGTLTKKMRDTLPLDDNGSIDSNVSLSSNESDLWNKPSLEPNVINNIEDVVEEQKAKDMEIALLMKCIAELQQMGTDGSMDIDKSPTEAITTDTTQNTLNPQQDNMDVTTNEHQKNDSQQQQMGKAAEDGGNN
jgi:hypothetical protein